MTPYVVDYFVTKINFSNFGIWHVHTYTTVEYLVRLQNILTYYIVSLNMEFTSGLWSEDLPNLNYIQTIGTERLKYDWRDGGTVPPVTVPGNYSKPAKSLQGARNALCAFVVRVAKYFLRIQMKRVFKGPAHETSGAEQAGSVAGGRSLLALDVLWVLGRQ